MRRKIMILCAVLSISAAMFSCHTSGDANSVITETEAAANDGDQPYLFLVKHVDLESDYIKNGNFIWIGDLSSSSMPDSYYAGFTLPNTKSVVTWRLSTLYNIARNAGVSKYVINGEESDKASFLALSNDTIQCITIDGERLDVTTRSCAGAPNADVDKAYEEESAE